MRQWFAMALLTLAAMAPFLSIAGAQSASPSPNQELPSIEGAPNPLDAPLVDAGAAVDTILQSETLWYAVDARPGQRVRATVIIVGRPDAPGSEDTYLEVTLTDPQRQPVTQSDAEFTGQDDAIVELPVEEILPVGGDRPLLSVALRSRTGQTDLEAQAFRLQIAVDVTGTPVPIQSLTPERPQDSAGPPDPAPTVTTAPPPPLGPAQPARDLVPIALVALAIGGFAGFELSRRGL